MGSGGGGCMVGAGRGCMVGAGRGEGATNPCTLCGMGTVVLATSLGGSTSNAEPSFISDGSLTSLWALQPTSTTPAEVGV